jgi:predicted metal-dependent peptidase
LKKYGESMHLMPNGEEGYEYSVEEAYKTLLAATAKPNKQNGNGQKGKGNGSGKSNGKTQADTGDSDDGEESGEKGETGGGKGSARPSLEDLIASIKKKNDSIRENLEKNRDEESSADGNDGGDSFDDHSFWEGDDDMGSQRDTWMNRMVEATDIIASMPDGAKLRGTVPAGVERIINELKNPILDWRTILDDFVQEEICDYSFSPPDKRMEDSPFFLPDFNEKDESAKNLLFMVDTSGSMSNEAITDCYSEIYGAIQQFNGKLTGKLGFFDAVVVEPVPFEDEDEFKIIRPKGGGGTSFHIIFNYVREKMQDDPPVSIIILTDGYAPYPDEAAAMDIPVLWIINNKEAQAPSWGKVARMISEENSKK